MAGLWRMVVVAAMVVVLADWSEPIPSRVANRMIPSWWISARSKKTCQRWSECGDGECCVRPMLASNSYCFPYKSLGETCDASALLIDMENEVFFDHCPCEMHLTCANLRVSSVCVDPDRLDQHVPATPARPSPKQIKL